MQQISFWDIQPEHNTTIARLKYSEHPDFLKKIMVKDYENRQQIKQLRNESLKNYEQKLKLLDTNEVFVVTLLEDLKMFTLHYIDKDKTMMYCVLTNFTRELMYEEVKNYIEENEEVITKRFVKEMPKDYNVHDLKWKESKWFSLEK